MNIEDLTIAQIRELAKFIPTFGMQSHDKTPALLQPGKKVFIRTVTLYFTGEIEQITSREIVLKDAAWVADTKRFADFLKDGPRSDSEIEPYPDGVVINREVVIDISPWKHDLPRVQR